MVGVHRLNGDDFFKETYGKTLWETRFWCKRSRQLTLFHCFFLWNWYLSRHCWRNLHNIMRPGKSIMEATKNLMSRVRGERPSKWQDRKHVVWERGWTRRCEDANGCQIAALKNDMILVHKQSFRIRSCDRASLICISELHCLQQCIYLCLQAGMPKNLVPQRIFQTYHSNTWKWMFPWIVGFPPKSSIKKSGFSIIFTNNPFWWVNFPLFLETRENGPTFMTHDSLPYLHQMTR